MEQLLEITAKMGHAVARDLGAVLRLGEYKGALQHRLRIECQALSTPSRRWCVERLRGFDILGDLCRVHADISLTRATNRGVRIVGLLHHGAEEAGEVGDRPGDERTPEIDVAEQAIQWIGELAIGCRAKKLLGQLREARGRRDGQIFLALEVMEERALA